MKKIKHVFAALVLGGIVYSFATAAGAARLPDGPQGLGPCGNVAANQLVPTGK